MRVAPFPEQEALRVATLRGYDILDSDFEPAFDAITQYIAKQFDAEIAVISLVDTDRQWFKAVCGLDSRETPRNLAFCAYTILKERVNYIPDATLDPRVKDNALVTGAPFIRFYCGAPLIAGNGQIIGSLCVIDSKPRTDFSEADQILLTRMAKLVIEQMDMRKAAQTLLKEAETRKDAEARALQTKANLGAFIDHVPVAIALIGADGRYRSRSKRYETLQRDLFSPDVQDNFIQSIRVREDWVAAFEAVLSGHSMKRTDDILIMQDGRSEYATWEMQPWYGMQDKIDGVVLSVTYVTEQVRARLDSERRNELFDTVLENIKDGIVACDAEGRLTLFNQRTRAMHGIDVVDLPIEECGGYYSLYEEDGVTPLIPDRVPLFRALKGDQVIDQGMVIAPDGLPKRDIVAQARQLRRKDGTVMGAMASMADVTKAKIATRKLEKSEAKAVHIAFHDTLTGLANRAQFNENYGRGQTIDPDKKIAAIFIDLNRFKLVNDTLGHKIGDDLLIRVSEILQDILGDRAFLARFGGDEFVAITEVGGEYDALRLGQIITDQLDSPVVTAGHTVATGAAVGIAISPDHGASVKSLVRRADIAMYKSKSEGQSGPVLFEPVFELDAVQRSLLETELRKSIINDELRVLFQPIVCGNDYGVQGVEALVRWEHPRLGLIGPDQFISIAEECGFIIALGEWVLDHALSQFADEPDMFVSVNLSPLQFRDPDLVKKISGVLKRTGFDPHNLELEVTESLLINDAKVAKRIIGTLKKMGIRIALDDFGTGYSSLSYIQEIPFNKVKIDRSFISRLGSSSESEAVVRCVVGLASALGMIVTAEGVESDAHEAALKLIGCQTLQGYKYGRPMTYGDLRARLDSDASVTRIPLKAVG